MTSLSGEGVVNIALVGCGRISRNHIRAIVEHHSSAKLVALCDVDEQRMEEVVAMFTELQGAAGIRSYEIARYSSYKRLLEDISKDSVRVELIVLTTPSGLHARQTIEAARYGLNVCTEKPMATKWSDGLEMVKACDANNVRLFVIKQNRLNSTLQLVKRQIDRERFGRIAMVSMNVFWQRPQEYYDQADWRGTWEFDGGALMNQASHYIDLADWLVGPVESVSALIGTIGRRIETEDTASLNIRWRNGTLGSMAVTMLSYPNNIEGSITILGEYGTVRVGGKAVNEIEKWEFRDEHPDDKEVGEASYETTSVYGYGHSGYYSNVLECLKTGVDPMCDGREGLKSLEVLIAAYRSARDRSVVSLPLDL